VKGDADAERTLIREVLGHDCCDIQETSPVSSGEGDTTFRAALEPRREGSGEGVVLLNFLLHPDIRVRDFLDVAVDDVMFD
jgi:hypothetical protein